MSAFESITTPPAVVRWMLAGPVGVELDALLALAINAGCDAEPAGAGRYRLAGSESFLTAYADAIGKVEGYSLAVEAPDHNAVSATADVMPVRPWRRTTVLTGSRACGFVARAVDRGLKVRPAGAMRWGVSGTTADQMAWWAAVRDITVADALAQWSLTADAAQAEDRELSVPAPEVRVEVRELAITAMPAREVSTTVTRDATGEIVNTKTIERDAP